MVFDAVLADFFFFVAVVLFDTSAPPLPDAVAVPVALSDWSPVVAVAALDCDWSPVVAVVLLESD